MFFLCNMDIKLSIVLHLNTYVISIGGLDPDPIANEFSFPVTFKT